MSFAPLILLLGYLSAPVASGPADGAVYLYLQPFSPEASRLTFAVASVSAIGANGVEYPLAVNLKTVGPAEVRQRLLGSGRLPTGRYEGFLFTIRGAALKDKSGSSPLVVPDAPVRLEAPFSVAGGQSPLLWLTLKYQESLTGSSDFSPAFSAVTPSRPIGDHAGFVTNAGSNMITVFDKNIAQAVAVIDTCAGPAGMALDQRRRRLYVACSKDDEIQWIDVTSGEIVQRGRLSPGDGPRELALTPDGGTLLSANAGSNTISFFDTVSLTKQDRINVGSGPNSVLTDPTGRRAFVFNTLSSTVSVLDIASRSVVATLSLDAAPIRGQFNQIGNRLYVIHERSPYLTVVDPLRLTIVTRARLGAAAGAIAIDNVRGLVCLAGSRETAVEFYDPNTLLPLYSMRTKAGIAHLVIDVEDSRLYMVNPDTRTLLIGRLADRKVMSEIDVGDGPRWVAVMGEK